MINVDQTAVVHGQEVPRRSLRDGVLAKKSSMLRLYELSIVCSKGGYTVTEGGGSVREIVGQ